MRVVQLLLSFLMFFICSVADAARWQSLGHDNMNGSEAYTFLDADSVTYTDNKNVRVWVESISASNLGAYLDKHKLELTEQAKIYRSSGYVPEVFNLEAIKRLNKSDYDVAVTTAAVFEYEANTYHIPVSSKTYIEIDCNEKRTHFLELINFDANGNISSRSGIEREWEFISPDSNAELLSLLFCKKES